MSPFRLFRAHPNYALMMLSIAIFHAWSAYIALANPESYRSPTLRQTREFLEPEQWGLLALATFILITVGWLAGHNTVSRIGLAMGTTIAFCRAGLLILANRHGYPTALGVPVWLLVAMIHLTMTMEPPTNPASAARR